MPVFFVPLEGGLDTPPLAWQVFRRREFVQGEGSIAQIASKHSVPFRTVDDWRQNGQRGKARERWLNGQAEAKESTVVNARQFGFLT